MDWKSSALFLWSNGRHQPSVLFLSCAVCWAIWMTRNKACFEASSLKTPIETICYAGALMRSWAGLYGEEDKAMLMEGVNIMLQVATRLLANSKEHEGGRGMLEGPHHQRRCAAGTLRKEAKTCWENAWYCIPTCALCSRLFSTLRLNQVSCGGGALARFALRSVLLPVY